MLFQHGLCGDAGQPLDVFPSDHFRCLTVECRGHGRSEAGDLRELSITTFTTDVADTLDDLALGPIPVGGISMGAAIAMRLAVTRPDLVSALVLARPAWAFDDAPPNMAPNAEVGELLSTLDREEARAAFERSAVASMLADAAPDNLASLRSFFGREPLAVTAALLTRVSEGGPGVTREQVATIRVPTLVIGHERDLVHPLALARQLADVVPGSRLTVIPPKADDLAGYRTAFRASLLNFLRDHAP